MLLDYHTGVAASSESVDFDTCTDTFRGTGSMAWAAQRFFSFLQRYMSFPEYMCAELRPQPNILYSSCWAHRDSLLPEYSNMNEKCFPLNVYRPPRLTFETRVSKNSSCLSQVMQIKTKPNIEAAIIFYFPFTSGEHTPQETKLLLLNAEVLHSTVVREDRIVDFWLLKM